MHANLIGYLLNALEEEEKRAVEEALAADAAIRRQLEILRFALTPLGATAEPKEPPQGLGRRTCQQLRVLRRGREEG